MRRMSQALAIAGAAVLAIAGPAVGQQATTPLDKILAIYARVVPFCNGEDVAPAYVDQFMRSTFDKAIADRYLQKLHRSALDFDIFIDGQDCKLTNLRIEESETSDTAAVVRVELDNFDKARTIDFQFRNAGGNWLVRDMVYQHRKFSLRAFLNVK